MADRDNSPAVVNETRCAWQLDVHLAEFNQLGDELIQRINLQNGAGQRALYLGATAAGLTVALYGYLAREGASAGSLNPRGPVLTGDAWTMFARGALWISAAYTSLVLLLISNWIYQTSVIFKIRAYVGFLGDQVIQPLIGGTGHLFNYHRLNPDAPWNRPFGLHLHHGFLQAPMIYALGAFGPAAMCVLARFEVERLGFTRFFKVALAVAIALFAMELALLALHCRLHLARRHVMQRLVPQGRPVTPVGRTHQRPEPTVSSPTQIANGDGSLDTGHDGP